MKPYRTVISVPGNKPSWYDKAIVAGADCLCLDLEDSVPPAEKESAREAIRDAIGRIAEQYPKVGCSSAPTRWTPARPAPTSRPSSSPG